MEKPSITLIVVYRRYIFNFNGQKLNINPHYIMSALDRAFGYFPIFREDYMKNPSEFIFVYMECDYLTRSLICLRKKNEQYIIAAYQLREYNYKYFYKESAADIDTFWDLYNESKELHEDLCIVKSVYSG